MQTDVHASAIASFEDWQFWVSLPDRMEGYADAAELGSQTQADLYAAATALRKLEGILREAAARKAVAMGHDESPQNPAAPVSAEARDAERYRKLKAAMQESPLALQSFLAHHNWHPDTFTQGIDETIDLYEPPRALAGKG